MSFSNISDILLELNRGDGSNQKSALALSNTSEVEIKTLLKQIDTMIYHKKLRWERQKQELDNKVQLKEQENQMQKAAIDQKNQEIGQLKKMLETMDAKTHDIMKKYEVEVETLHEQLNRLKTDYIKVQKKYKRNKPNGNNKRRSSGGASLNSSISEMGAGGGSGSGSADHGYSSSSNVHEQQTRNKILKYENDLQLLKSHINDYKLKEIEYFHDKEKLQKQIDQYKDANQDLHRKINELTKTIAASSTHTDLKLNFENELRKRDEHIKNIESQLKTAHNEKKNEIELKSHHKEEIKKYKKQETAIRHELNKLKLDYEEATKRLNNLESENRKMKNKTMTNSEKIKDTEILNLKKRLHTEKERHLLEMQNLKSEIMTYTTQLTDKNTQIKSLNEKINTFECFLKQKDEKFDNLNKELSMANAHLDALRLENHFLRHSVVDKKNDEKEMSDIQRKYHQLIELSDNENKRLKNEVIQLTKTIEELRKHTQSNNIENNFTGSTNTDNADLNYRRLKIIKDEYEKQFELLKQQHEISLKRLNNEIEKLNSEKYVLAAELDAAKHHQTQQSHHQTNYLSVNGFTSGGGGGGKSNYSSLNADTVCSGSLNSGLSTNLINTDDLYKKFRSDNTNASNCKYDEQPISSRSEAYLQDQTNTKTGSTKKFNLLPDIGETVSPTTNIRLSLSSQFRIDEQKRKKDLENLLDSHIDALRKSSGMPGDIHQNNFIKT